APVALLIACKSGCGNSTGCTLMAVGEASPLIIVPVGQGVCGARRGLSCAQVSVKPEPPTCRNHLIFKPTPADFIPVYSCGRIHTSGTSRRGAAGNRYITL